MPALRNCEITVKYTRSLIEVENLSTIVNISVMPENKRVYKAYYYPPGQRPRQFPEPRSKETLLRCAEKDNTTWTYGEQGTCGAFRLVSVAELLDPKDPRIHLTEWHDLGFPRDGIRLELGDPPDMPRYCALSHVWQPSEDAAEISERANRPLLIEVGEAKLHKISWLGLIQAATAAKSLYCEYLWLDLLCLNQRSHEDKVLQIKNMSRVYSNAMAVVVMVGGVVAAQSMGKPSSWIHRAWTFQEATLCFQPWVLLQWNLPGSFQILGGLSISKLKGNVALVRLSELLELTPGQSLEPGTLTVKGREIEYELNFPFCCLGTDRTAMIALEPGLRTPKSQSYSSSSSTHSTHYGDDVSDNGPWEDIPEDDSDGGSGRSVGGGNQSPNDGSNNESKGDHGDEYDSEPKEKWAYYQPIGGPEFQPVEILHIAAWRSMWLRTSTKPQDLVFSVMHFLGAFIEVDYKRPLNDLIFELTEKSPIPAWLAIGYDIPVNPKSGLIPILPTFAPNSVPNYVINGKTRLASELVYADYYCGKFDVVIKSSSMVDGHTICAQLFDIHHSSPLRKDEKDSSFHVSELCLSCPTYEFNADCKFKGNMGDVVMIVGPTQTRREVNNYEWSGMPFVHLLSKNGKGVWIKTGAGTLDEPVFKRKDYLMNVVRRHLRVGGGPGAEMVECDCNISLEEKALKEQLEKDTDVLGTDLDEALIKASSKSDERLIRRLLDMGADVNAYRKRKGTPLHVACVDGKARVVRLLIEKGANTNAEGGPHGSPLQTACYWGWEPVARLLLENGAAVNGPAGPDGTALQCAMRSIGLIKLLLEFGADPNATGGKYGTCLMAAARSTFDDAEEIIQLLLDKGADINSTDGLWTDDLNSRETYCTALQIACSSGELQRVRFLLARGADPNVAGGSLNTALQVAAKGAKTLLMRTLIEHGADIHAHGGVYGNALQAAARANTGQSIEAIRLLLENGIDINVQGGKYGNVLQAATSANMPDEKLVKFLLKNGADVNAKGGYYGTALQGAAAANNPSNEVASLLLRAGADVNAQGGYYGNALQAAAAHCSCAGKLEGQVVWMLLENGADVNAQGGYYGNALQAAAQSWIGDDRDNMEERLVRLLINKGAHVNAVGGHYGTALQGAAYCPKGDKRVVAALIENGADVNARGGEFVTALQAALHAGNTKIAAMLIEAGADIDVEEKYQEALQKALKSSAPNRGTQPKHKELP